MADNVSVGGINYSTDDVTTLNGATITAGTAQTQRMKVQFGDDGTARDASSTFPLPVDMQGAALGTTSGSIAAGSTGTVGPLSVSKAGNVTFVVKNTTAGSAFGGAPVVVFEQSDDDVQWAPLTVTNNGTQEAASTFTLPANAANAAMIFEAPLESVAWVRARVTTGPTTNPMTIAIGSGGGFFMPMVTAIDRKDTGRTVVAVNYTATTAATTEALATTLVLQKGATNSTALTSIPVTTGKRLRITSVAFGIRTTTANLPWGQANLRVNFSGTVTATSPMILQLEASGGAAAIGAGGSTVVATDIELVPGNQFGVTFQGNLATNVHTLTVAGYEYTA